MAKRRRRSGVRRPSARRNSGGGGGGGGGRGMLGGYLSKDVLYSVGGAVGASLVGPMIANLLPAQMAKSRVGQIAGAAIVGFVGYFALRKFNRNAAIGWASASLSPVVSSFIPRNLDPSGGTQGLGYYDDDEGVSGLGFNGVPDGPALIERDGGVGDYTDEAVELIPTY